MRTTTAHDAHTGPSGDSEHPLMFAARAWDRFWFHPADPTSLGLIRITAGCVILYIHLIYCIGLMGYIGPDAWVSNNVLEFLRLENAWQGPSSTWDDTGGDTVKGQTLWSIYYHVENPAWLWFIHSTVLAIMFLFTIGLGTRVTSALTWICAIMYIQRLPSMLFGMDTMMNLVLLYLMIAPCGAALSIDRWLKVRRERARLGLAYVPRPPEPLVSANYALRLMQINFCIIYLASGTSKLLGTSWWNGTAPTRVLLNYSFAPFDVPAYTWVLTFMSKHRWLWEIFMAGGVVYTLVVEIGFPFLVWNRRLRWVMVSGSILLHTMIGLFMGLVTFSLMMLALVLAFVPPEVVRQGLLTLGEQVRQLVLTRILGVPAREKQALALSR